MVAFGLLLLACSKGEGSQPEQGAGLGGAATRDLGSEHCVSDAECMDGLFCNGAELCAPDADDADEFGCISARVRPTCDDGVRCTIDVCSDALGRCEFLPPDEDGDGHGDASCVGEDGAPIGDDCDDEDGNRFPGNAEFCDPEDHDEDCDPTTFGEVDRDGDGEFDSECCNEDGDERHCGTDCNDASIAQRSRQPEFCDDIDNDCNGVVLDSSGVYYYQDTARTVDCSTLN